MKYNLDEMIDRKHTNCEKWDRLEETFPKAKAGSLALWVADMDFACAKPIQDALHARIDKQIFGYTHPQNSKYQEVVQAWFQRRFAWDIAKEDMFFSPGVVPALSYLIRILSKPGQGIVIQEPVYYPFARCIKQQERVVLNNQLLNEDGNYRMDLKDLEEKLKDENTAGMILCSPHNPVGRVWRKDELHAVVDLALTYQKWIIADEIHCDLVRSSQQHIPLMKLRPDASDFIIACTAPSKSFNLAGLQNSNIIIHNETYKQLWKQEIIAKLHIGEPNCFAHIATMAAYGESEDWLNQVNAYIDENIAYACARLKKELPEVVISPSEGTYLLWIDMRKYCDDQDALEEKMQTEAGVLFDEGYLFGACGVGFERINCACPRSILKEAIDRMVAVFAK